MKNRSVESTGRSPCVFSRSDVRDEHCGLLTRAAPLRALSSPDAYGAGSFARSESGSALVEFAIVLTPLLALLLFAVDVGWSIFEQATLQNAVREGVRFAVTGQTLPGYSCLGASVQQIVARNSFGFIPTNQAANYVAVTYYSPTDLSQITGASGPAGGNVVQVAVSGISVRSVGPLWRNTSPIPLWAMSSDVMESPPNMIPPCP